MEQTLTHHCIDGLAEWDDLAPWDQALDTFRRIFPLPLIKVDVADDGKSMKYRLRGTKLMENYMEMARLAIYMHRLPLVVSRDRFAIGKIVFEDDLIITYVPQKR